MRRRFGQFASWVATAAGSPYAFGVAAAAILVWGALGPMLGFSQAWQLWVNTGTTITTFLLVFLLQYTQNRDTRALHAKLDDLIHASEQAHNHLIGIEQADPDEIEQARRNALPDELCDP